MGHSAATLHLNCSNVGLKMLTSTQQHFDLKKLPEDAAATTALSKSGRCLLAILHESIASCTPN
jgi:hypothetical protein